MLWSSSWKNRKGGGSSLGFFMYINLEQRAGFYNSCCFEILDLSFRFCWKGHKSMKVCLDSWQKNRYFWLFSFQGRWPLRSQDKSVLLTKNFLVLMDPTVLFFLQEGRKLSWSSTFFGKTNLYWENFNNTWKIELFGWSIYNHSKSPFCNWTIYQAPIRIQSLWLLTFLIFCIKTYYTWKLPIGQLYHSSLMQEKTEG